MKKAGKFLGCFAPILAALLCQYAASFLGMIVAGVLLGIKAGLQGVTNEMEAAEYMLEQMMSADVLMIITGFATLLTLVVGALWYSVHRPATDFKLKEVMNGKLFAAMFCLGLSLQFLISMCLNALYPVLPQDMTNAYSELMETLIGGNVWLSLIVTVILAPLAEEFLFRGITLKKAQKIMPFMAANVLQAVLFGVYHMNLIQGVYAFVLGMILGYTAEYFHSIWASILLHACVNGSADILSNLPESITSTYVGIIAIAVSGVVLLFVAAKLYPKARTERPAAESEDNQEENELFRKNSFDEY
ncbi:MAG: CPBP family intramembrane metalloprotease [Lachnospiraceae bacterium]|nr:CPBP family intramembrane metalloprotease [Lachnospiraceae bacterium]